MKKLISLILTLLLVFSLFGFNASAATKPDALVNSLYKLQSGSFKVGYFGGSVTVGAHASNAEKTSWRAITRDWFKTNFPNATVTEVNAAVGATGSNFGIFRAEKQLIKDKAPDLCFIEFAVNDLWLNADYAGKNFQTAYANIEGIIKKIYASNPKADIVFVITGEIDSLRVDATSDVPFFGEKYTELAEYYNLPIIYVGRELVRTIYKENGNKYPASKDDAAWRKYYDDIVHPIDKGYAHYANTITTYLKSKLLTGYTATASDYTNHLNPEITYCEKNMLGDLYLDADMLNNISQLKNCSNSGFTQSGDVIKSTKNGDSIEFDFQSPNVGIWYSGGAKIEIEYSIDGGAIKNKELYQADGTHRMFILGTNLSDGTHRLKINRVGGTGNLNIQGVVLSGKPYVGKLADYNKLPQSKMPNFKLEGVNGGTKKMYISCDTSGATVYYTLDGSDPKSSSTKKTYKTAISLSKDVVIKAYSTKSGMRDSDVSSFDYKTYMEGYAINSEKNDSNGFTFTTNGETSKITTIKLDGQILEKTNYSISKENKTITLKPEFLKKINVGDHTLIVVFMDGDASCSFKFEGIGNGESENNTESTENNVAENTETENKKKESLNQKTLLIIVIVVVAVIVIGSIVAMYLIMKKKFGGEQAEETTEEISEKTEN